jgi:hypothetical protein
MGIEQNGERLPVEESLMSDVGGALSLKHACSRFHIPCAYFPLVQATIPFCHHHRYSRLLAEGRLRLWTKPLTSALNRQRCNALQLACA